MRLGRTLVTFALGLGLVCSAGAQEQKGFFGRTIDKLTAPLRELDPDAVYQPKPRWTFALTGDFHQAGMTQDISVNECKNGPNICLQKIVKYKSQKGNSFRFMIERKVNVNFVKWQNKCNQGSKCHYKTYYPKFAAHNGRFEVSCLVVHFSKCFFTFFSKC